MNTANSQAAHWSLLTKDLDVDYFFRGEGIFHVAHPETSFSAQEVVEDKYRNTLLQRDEYLISTHHGQGLAIMYWYDLEF